MQHQTDKFTPVTEKLLLFRAQALGCDMNYHSAMSI
jgi:hypothetical protein